MLTTLLLRRLDRISVLPASGQEARGVSNPGDDGCRLARICPRQSAAFLGNHRRNAGHRVELGRAEGWFLVAVERGSARPTLLNPRVAGRSFHTGPQTKRSLNKVCRASRHLPV